MRAIVLAVGDLGRSPRTLLHAQALAAEGVEVDLVGCRGAALPSSVTAHATIVVHWLTDGDEHATPARPDRWSLLGAVSRGIGLTLRLTAVLFWRTRRPDVILVQNPPGVPAMAVAWLAARLRGARLAVDWHNLTSSMLSLRLGDRHPLVRAVGVYERLLGRSADVNLFVSAAMGEDLGCRFGLAGTVFRDRPAERFVPLSTSERLDVRSKLFVDLGLESLTADAVLLVSPTSWTADEDFGLLLEALRRYDDRASSRADADATTLPPLVVAITGRGPLKQAYEAEFARTPLSRVHIRTLWLEADEYPRVLAAADLGLCLHASSSGLDLPMKIADLFGVQVPVLAFDYGDCLREVVQPGVNGLLFKTADELAGCLETTLGDSGGSRPELERLRAGARRPTALHWNEAWRLEARTPLIG